jgi:hypothetical protein
VLSFASCARRRGFFRVRVVLLRLVLHVFFSPGGSCGSCMSMVVNY